MRLALVSGNNSLECASVGCTHGNSFGCCVCRDICLFGDFVLFELARAYSFISCQGTIETHLAYGAHTPPRTPSAGVYSWVGVSARGKTRGKNRER